MFAVEESQRIPSLAAETPIGASSPSRPFNLASYPISAWITILQDRVPSASKTYSSLPPLLRYSLVNSRALASMT